MPDEIVTPNSGIPPTEQTPESMAPLTRKQRRELKRQAKLQQRASEVQKHSRRRLAVWGGALLAIILVIFGMAKLASQTPEDASETTSGEKVASLAESDWMQGNKDAKIVLIEYSDLQCPACGYYYPIVKRLGEEFADDQLAIIYRHFPLKTQHKNAEEAAWAAEAAGKQGRFWEMHDKLFEEQTSWSNLWNPKERFEEFAQVLRLDMDKFKEDYASDDVKNALEEDIESGNRARVDSTPSFFLNGSKITNPGNFDRFKELINKELQKVSVSVPEQPTAAPSEEVKQ